MELPSVEQNLDTQKGARDDYRQGMSRPCRNSGEAHERIMELPSLEQNLHRRSGLGVQQGPW